jgi:hypothetical protein
MSLDGDRAPEPTSSVDQAQLALAPRRPGADQPVGDVSAIANLSAHSSITLLPQGSSRQRRPITSGRTYMSARFAQVSCALLFYVVDCANANQVQPTKAEHRIDTSITVSPARRAQQSA